MTRMAEIFQRQRETMEKFEAIEQRNGLLEWKGTICSDDELSNPYAQAKMRRLAWSLTEEIGEALDLAWKGSTKHEEFADAFHYLIELLYVVQTPLPYETLEQAFEENPFQAPRIATSDVFWISLIVSLTMAINQLKNRPHKQSAKFKTADIVKFRSGLLEVFDYFIRACEREGITSGVLSIAFFNKAQINDQRIQS